MAPAQRRQSSRSLHYEWPPNHPNPERFDSVTSIISGGVPKPALKAWGERTVAEFAWDQHDVWFGMERDEAIDWLKRAPFRATDRAAAQGSDVHAWAEAYVLGHAPAVDDVALNLRPYLKGFLAWLAECEPRFEMTEASVYNRTFGYAGTLDFIARVEGIGLVLGDYKTSKGVYGEVGLQLAAYRHAEFVGLPDGTEAPMPEVDACYVLHLTPKGYQFRQVTADETVWRYFCHAQQVKWFLDAVGPNCVGDTWRRPLHVVQGAIA